MTTYFVTGGTGNIGVFVTKELVRHGDRVVAYDLLPQRDALEVVLTPGELARTTVVQGDVLDLERIVRTLKAHRVDKIAHLAAAGTVMCVDNPAHGMRTNVVGTNNIFEAALMVGVQRVMFASSGAVFGPRSAGPDDRITYDSIRDPQNVYGATKAMNEIAAAAYTKQYGLDIVGLRLAGYGPVAGGMSVKWVPELIEALVHGRPGSAVVGSRQRYWLYVEDTARAVAATLNVDRCPNVVLQLPAGFPATDDEVVAIIRRAIPDASIATDTPGLETWSRKTAKEVVFDGSMTTELLQWRPTVTVEEGIAKIIEHYRRLSARTT